MGNFINLISTAYGIDVFVVHPGPVDTSFYDNAPNLLLFTVLSMYFFPTISFINLTKITGWLQQTPDAVADVIINNLGRTTSLDAGLFAYATKVADKVLTPNVMVHVVSAAMKFFPDMEIGKRHQKTS